MKTIVLRFSVSAISAAVLFSLIGIIAPLRNGEPMTPQSASDALQFTFSRELDPVISFEEAHGWSVHGVWTRRSFVEGHRSGNKKTGFSEQVLKVGWPFTVVRGFIHGQGESQHTHGAIPMHTDDASGAVRMLPFLPVWPGLVFYGIVGTVLLSVTAKGRRK